MRRMLGSAVVALLLGAHAAPADAKAKPACTGVRDTWREVGHSDFLAPLGLIRSQGLTTHASDWWFSWQGGLSRADNAYDPTLVSPIAIPPDLAVAGSNHIGDIDYDRGRIIAPIEDGNPPLGGPAYQHPWLVLYDATTLLPTGERYELPQALHVAGVPWVAVDHHRRLAITAEWDNTRVLNLWDIDHGMRHAGQVTLAHQMGRIQGAKVLGRWLYTSRDDAMKSVERIDLRTGAIEDLYRTGYSGEQEGIAVAHTKDGALVHVLFVHGSTSDPTHLQVTLHHIAAPCSFHL